MERVLEGLKPEQVFYYFEEISKVPRESRHEEKIAQFLCDFAKKHGLEHVKDAYHNVVIRKPGSAGKENNAYVMLQGHMDMVCEKIAGSDHDFQRDPIELEVVDGNITAKGTTLGADNGIAVALMMAILADENAVHPPLECVFTTSEEIGLIGAHHLDFASLKAKKMINLDSEEEGVATVSCAGGLRITATRPAERIGKQGVVTELKVEGLTGGHSGSDIHKERGNAILVMGRLLESLLANDGVDLIEVSGGNKDNAIPRNVTAKLLCKDEATLKLIEEKAALYESGLHNIFGKIEPNVKVTVSAADTAQVSANVLSSESVSALISLIRLIPNGVQSRKPDQGGFVLTSSNVGIVRTEDDKLTLVCAPRSSVPEHLEDLKDKIKLLARLNGFTTEYEGEYPGWQYEEVSQLRDVFGSTYKDLFHMEMRMEAIHAGLECGLFSSNISGLDAIAVGPDIFDCHTTEEHLPIQSAEHFYELLLEVLKRL